MADPSALEAAFERFNSAQSSLLSLSLTNLRGVSSESLNAAGTVTVDLATGAVTSVVQLLPPADFDLWLVDNRSRPGHTTLAEDFDVLMMVGRFEKAQGQLSLSVPLGREAFTDFFPDRAFVVRSGDSPVRSFVLTGTSTLFERLRHRQVRFVDDSTAVSGFDPTASARRATDFARIVTQGRHLFLREPFNGNGRTCGTCHVEANNLTIDPDLIATLRPSDPLFVAETNSALAALENPVLMRQFGLILVNADGFEPDANGPQFVLRATQNVQALANSSVAPTDGSVDFTVQNFGNLNPSLSERLGWGNDGAPLRDFAIVAIAQHATRTLSRARGMDFRVPTDEELDALAAYQLSLGRQEDFDLPSLVLKSPLASSGKALYLDTGIVFQPGHKNCNACHFNGGGTAALSFSALTPGFPVLDRSPRGINMTAETNVNAIPLALTMGLPRDGGFGQVFLADLRSFGNRLLFPPMELEGFNSPSVVESADTGPYFHSHMIEDLESTVAFYGTPAFQSTIWGLATPVSISPEPTDPEVQAIAAFLRLLNALENIRSSINVAERGRAMTSADDARDLSELALAETIDAIEVLSEGAFANRIEPGILLALDCLHAARITLEGVRDQRVPRTIPHLLRASVRYLRTAREHLVDPATLPQSFRN